MNYLEWDIGSNLAKLNGTLYSIGYKDGSNYFEHGRHAIFFSNPNESTDISSLSLKEFVMNYQK